MDAHRQSQGEFVVSNRTNDPYWQVWLRFTLHPDTTALPELEIAVIERSQLATRTDRASELDVEPINVITHDEEGNRFSFLMIDRLRPREYLYLVARLPFTPQSVEHLKLCIDLWSYGKGPLAISFGAGLPTLRIDFPVPLWGNTIVIVKGKYRFRGP